MSVIPNAQFQQTASVTNNIHTNNSVGGSGSGPVIANNYVTESQVLDKKR